MTWFNSFPISYAEPIFRPPAEAASFLLQVTLGCSHNSCSFCAMYRNKKYQVRAAEAIAQDIKRAADFYRRNGERVRKVFLCDGDALAAPADLLLKTADDLKRAFVGLRRIGIYASARNVLEKSDTELAALAARGISLAYIGIESGSAEVLNLLHKGNTAVDMADACLKLRRCGWKISAIFMIGAGGRELSAKHSSASADLISQVPPDFLSFLTTVSVPGTPYARKLEKNEIVRLTMLELLQESRMLLAGIRLEGRRIIFRANHVSNRIPLEGNLPRDTENLLGMLDRLIETCPPDCYPDLSPDML